MNRRSTPQNPANHLGPLKIMRLNDSETPDDETTAIPSPDTVQLPPEDVEDKDPPAYDSMYPGKAPEYSQGRSCPAEDNVTCNFRTPRMEVRNDGVKGAECEEKAAAGGTLQNVKEDVSCHEEKKEGMCLAMEVLRDFCTKTTAHGFSHVVKDGQPLLLRLFWVTVIGVGILLLVSASYEVTHASLIAQRPSIEIVYRDLYSTGMRVPFITVCSLAGFAKSKLTKHNVSDALASYLLLAVRGTEIISPALETNPARKTVLKGELDAYLEEHNLTVSEMVTLLSPSCEDLVAVCMSSTKTMFRLECCREVLKPTLTGLGQCYTTRSPQVNAILRQTFAGLLGGYKVIFAVNTSEQIIYDSRIVSSPSLAEAGIHVSLSTFDLSPSVATSMQPLRVAPNTAASVAVSYTSLNKRERYKGALPWSVPTCVTEESFWNLTEEERSKIHHNFFFHISYRTCPLQLTNCTLLARSFTNDTTADCHPSDILHHKVMDDQMTDCLYDHLYRDVSDNKLCEVTEMTQQMSHTTLVPEMLEAHEGITVIPDLTYSMINIYYTQLGYTEHKENIPTVFTWFSGLGGQMGLFLGASVITLVEIYFTLCRVLHLLLTAFVAAFCREIRRCLGVFRDPKRSA
ncbi:acid-sensing ion channel 1-like isoform X3 [Portunus trituberculatus]|nr:acid-sensing ion channel 1-like isoform X3 [Portunus trituberculatus]XP_045118366.1 acid-sensing ion channel 1-like isoform X3 [Portunus trituberculatus]